MEKLNPDGEYVARSWQDFWDDGCRYLEVAGRAFPGNGKFTPEILYHMIGMGLENLFMAWLGQNNNMPENHTVRDFVRAADKLEPLPDDFRKELIRFDRFMGLCSLIPVPMDPPKSADVPAMLETGRRTREYLAARYIPEAKPAEASLA